MKDRTKRLASLPALALAVWLSSSVVSDFRGDYLGQKPPGETPALFAPGLISTQRMEHGSPAFSPDGREIYWSSLSENPTRSDILVMKREKNGWTSPCSAPFSSGQHVDFNPVFSPDGRRLYFRSVRPIESGSPPGAMNLWFVEREAEGWTEPRPLDRRVNTGRMTSCSVTREGRLYFSSMTDAGCDIYSSDFKDGRYAEPVKLDAPINTGHIDIDPFIAPDESYLMFESNRPGGYGSFDIYVSFRQKDGAFGPPVNLGDRINSASLEAMPMVSPDGKYCFFVGD
jgi:Tol biopolymer transport system component